MSRILSIAPYQYLPATSGGQVAISNANKVLALQNELAVLTEQGQSKSEVGVKMLPILPKGKKKYLPFVNQAFLEKSWEDFRPQFVFCNHPYLFPSVARFAKKHKVPWYIRAHNIEAQRFKQMGKVWWSLMESFERKAFLKSDGVFFITEEDAQYAIANYGLPSEKAIIMPFGTDLRAAHAARKSKEDYAGEMKLDAQKVWLVFVGALNYAPNADAVQNIIDHVYPRLQKSSDRFQILICGKGLPEQLHQKIKSLGSEDVKYLGFVDDLQELLAQSHILLNTVTYGGGIKTKVIEALAADLTVVSTFSGAIGVAKAVCEEKLKVADDDDWDAFAELVLSSLDEHVKISKSFYDYYYIENIADRVQPYFL